MSSPIVINKALQQLGLNGSHPHLDTSQADKKTSQIASLAKRIDVPPNTVKALITGNLSRLSAHNTDDLNKLHAYLIAASRKPGTKAKGNEPLVSNFARLTQQAIAMKSARAHQQDLEANSIVVNAFATLAIQSGRKAGEHHLHMRNEALQGRPVGVSLAQRQQGAARKEAAKYVQQGQSLARTGHDKDTMRLAQFEADRAAQKNHKNPGT